MSMQGIGGMIRKQAEKPANMRLHSEAHALADELRLYFNEPTKFAMYLGVIKRIGVPQARAIFSTIKGDSGKVDNPRKLFMWMASAKAREKKPPEAPAS